MTNLRDSVFLRVQYRIRPPNKTATTTATTTTTTTKIDDETTLKLSLRSDFPDQAYNTKALFSRLFVGYYLF